MNNKNDGVNEYYPIERGTVGRADDRDQTADGSQEELTSPREDAAETTRDCAGTGPRPGEGTEPSRENSVGSRRTSDTKVALPDGGQMLEGADPLEQALDLTNFQLSELAVAAGDAKSGQEIVEELNELPFENDITHGRLYPNLDTLVEADLIEKNDRDRRTCEYPTTERGQRVLSAYYEWLEDAVDEFEGQTATVGGFHREQSVELTGFQVALLASLSDDRVSGQTIKDRLEEIYNTEINHGRLYPNLGTLVDLDCIGKDQFDRRTNSNELTADGRAVLVARLRWLRDQGLATNGGDA